jgi:hypothetical protein
MTFDEAQWSLLVGHPAQEDVVSGAVRGIHARVRGSEPATLVFQYVLRAEMSRIRVPTARATDRADSLWKHTCFEAFIAVAGEPGYYELNFSPSRQWAVYRFSGYREGMSPPDVTSLPELNVRSFDDRFELDAVIRLPDLIARRGERILKLALTAVVEDDNGTLSYWALKHAPDKPDFHHSDGFVLELPL